MFEGKYEKPGSYRESQKRQNAPLDAVSFPLVIETIRMGNDLTERNDLSWEHVYPGSLLFYIGWFDWGNDLTKIIYWILSQFGIRRRS